MPVSLYCCMHSVVDASGLFWQVQLRRQKHKDAASSGDSSEMTSPSPASCDLHELTSSPTSSDSEDDQPQDIDEDIFLRPSTYRLPGDAVTETSSASPGPCAAVNGMLSSSETEDDDDAVGEILSPSEDDSITAAYNNE